VPIINKEPSCDICVKENEIQKERIEAFEGQKKKPQKK